MRIYVLGPVPDTDEEVNVFAQTACKLAQAGYVPVMPYWFLVSGATPMEELRRSLSAMLLTDGIALIKRNYADKTVSAAVSLAKEAGIDVHTLPYWLQHHPHDYPAVKVPDEPEKLEEPEKE